MRIANWSKCFPDCVHLTECLRSGGSRNYGYDPLGLAQDAANLARFRESELMNGRWAMLGVAGSLAVEILGLGNWYTGPSWVR